MANITFNILEVDKPLGGALRFTDGAIGYNVVCNEYDWTAGAIDVIYGSFTAPSLTNGITGNFYATDGGTITLGQYGSDPQLKGNLYINGGTINIIAAIESQWPGNGNASITMSDGELNVYPYGIEIVDNPPYTFTTNITGGTIRTEGAFINNRADFNPTGGTLELYGNGDAGLSMIAGSLWNLTVNKTTSAEVVMIDSVFVSGLTNIIGGTLLLMPGTVFTSHNHAYVRENGTLWIREGAHMRMEHAHELGIDGGTLKVHGLPTNLAYITRRGNFGSMAIVIMEGGTISARNAYFSDMVNGVFVFETGWVDPDNAFTNCTFENGYYNMLRIENNQDLVITDVHFPSTTAPYNVKKTSDWGTVTFVNASGSFAGSAFENDPYNRIHWIENQFSVDVTVYLEGPFNGTDMNTDLNAIIPLQQTLTVVGYNGTEEVDEIPNADVVDWIGLELRDAADISSATEATAIGGGAFFLLKDGSIVGLDGSSLPTFDGEISQQLFVVIWHRNHLPVISAYPLIETGGTYTYDFTTGTTQAYGDTDGYKQWGTGVAVMVAGDGNADGHILLSDKINVWTPQAAKKGYYPGDFNMDSQVDNADKNYIWVPNNDYGYSSQIPE
jgi:hypothetical protein